MKRKIIVFGIYLHLSFISTTLVADDTLLTFYKYALENLQYDKTYNLYKESNSLQKSAVNKDRFAKFALDASYASTKAQRLPSSFYATSIALSDTIDLFGKSSYKIKELSLHLQENKTALNIQKESFFTTLVTMISEYRQTQEKLALHASLLDEQQKIFDRLTLLNNVGTVSNMDLLRFKNTLTLLKTQIIEEQNSVMKMKQQLDNYVPNQAIPSLADTAIASTKEQYLEQDQNLMQSDITALQLINQSLSLSHSYLPELAISTAYQKIDDPTANGDNYSFNLALHIPLSSGDYKQSEALRAEALGVKSHKEEYKIQRENEYIQKIQTIKSAVQQLKILEGNLSDYQHSEDVIKVAYIKKYVDFNTYIQVLTQTLNIKEQIIQMKYQKNRETILLNAIASGAIYE